MVIVKKCSMLKPVKSIVDEWKQACNFASWDNDGINVPGIPKGLYFIETNSKVDAYALIKFFKSLGVHKYDYYLETDVLSAQTRYSVWWRNKIKKT